MATIKELMEVGEKMNLKAAELKQFVEEQREQQKLEREKERELQLRLKELEKEEKEREKELRLKELERAEKEKEYEKEIQVKELELRRQQSEADAEFRRLKAESDERERIKSMELDTQVKLKQLELKLTESTVTGSRHNSEHGDEGDTGSASGSRHESSGVRRRLQRPPKLPPFEEHKDDMDAYLNRFERYATGMGWDKEDWSMYLSALLKGKALEVYARLPVESTHDYDVLKAALLRRFELTEEGFRKRFYQSKREGGEAPLQFVTRLRNYLDRWIDLANVGDSAEAIKDFLVKEQYIATCDKDLATFLRERAMKESKTVAQLAAQYVDARGGDRGEKKYSASGTERRQDGGLGRDGKKIGAGQPHNGTGEKLTCFVCGKMGHKAKDCYKRVKVGGFKPQSWTPRYRRQDTTTSGVNGRMGSTEETALKTRVAESTYNSQGNGVSGRMVWQCTRHDRINCQECRPTAGAAEVACGLLARPELKLECGCTVPVLACKEQGAFGKLFPMEGKLNGSPVQVLRDSGCTAIVVRRSLVPDEQMLDEKVRCVRIDGTATDFELAEVEIETPWISGNVRAICMENPLFDVMVGNVSGLEKNQRCHRQSCIAQAVMTRAQSKKEKIEPQLKVLREVNVQLTSGEIIELQKADDSLKSYWDVAQPDDETNEREGITVRKGILFRRKCLIGGKMARQLLVPKTLQQKILKLAHDQALGGHLGQKKTLDRIQAHFHWKGVQGDVIRWCKSCDVCQRMEAKSKVGKAPLGEMPLIDIPFKRVAVDLIGPITPIYGRGNRYILTLVDYATRYPEATALRNIEATTVAEALVEMFTRIGIPEKILSDQGSQFTSGVMKGVERLLSVKHLLTAPYNPRCNGLVERYNGTLKSMLRKLCVEKPQDWDRYLPAVMFAYREVPQESLGFSPFELVYGRAVRGPMQILKELWTKETSENESQTLYQYVVDLKDRLQHTCEVAQQELQRARKKQKVWYDRRARRRVLQAGEKVLLLLPTDHNKLTMAWKEPFEVLQRVSEVDYRIQMAGKTKVFHVNMLKKYLERMEESPDMEQEKDEEQEIAPQLGAVIDGEQENSMELLRSQQTESYKDVDVNSGLEPEVHRAVWQLLEEFQDIFTDVPGNSRLGEHRIDLSSTEPVRSKAYPLPYALREKLDKELDEMLRMGVIERSEAKYSSPIVIVPKSDQSLRICADFRKLNEKTIFDPEPIVTADEIFSQLAEDCTFSKFDFSKGYWQIPVRVSDRDATTIVTHRGLFRFVKMPYGLVGAPATYSRMMRLLLDRATGVHNYMDDCLVHAPDWKSHLSRMKAFFHRVRRAGLTLRPTKCAIGQDTISYLGFELSTRGLQPSQRKVEKILQAPAPKLKKQVRSFLGLAGYYRSFVQGFSEMVADLVELTKKGQPNQVHWEEKHEQAFRRIKEKLANTPILRLPDVTRPFTVQTDASARGLGAVLLQEYEGCLHPVEYASKLLSGAARHYATVEKECLAVVWALGKFQNYLLGNTFVLETDHAPLQYLRSAKYQNSRLMRWSMLLQPYKYVVKYIRGCDNFGADYMSRMYEDSESEK